MKGWHYESYRHSLAARGLRSKWPSEKEFMDHHRTGSISEDAYEQYSTKSGISWLGEPERYPHLLKTLDMDEESIEIRLKLRKNVYVKQDSEMNIIRDEHGDVIDLTDDEIKEKGYRPYDPTIVAFNEKGEPVGFASIEWGASGVWVVKDYQHKGIGFELLKSIRKYFEEDDRMGQMTYAGKQLCRTYYRRMRDG